jgi:hypothetical protein
MPFERQKDRYSPLHQDYEGASWSSFWMKMAISIK